MTVTSSDKLDNKLSNKQTESDNILAEIVCIWPELPEHIKAAIKALVQTQLKVKKVSEQNNGESL